MTREQIEEQLHAQYEAIRDIIDLDGVWSDTAFYGYMNAAEFAISMAITRVGNVTEGDDGHETD